jgi:crotonobetainyl-CoA:carnitine CoA-transferase CaiB-like acyl-CoA transferase
VRLPIRYSVTPLAAPVAAPSVGQHTREVLESVLSLDSERVDALSRQGAFGPEGLATRTRREG